MQKLLNWLSQVDLLLLVRLVTDFEHFLVDYRVDVGVVFLVIEDVRPQFILDIA